MRTAVGRIEVDGLLTLVECFCYWSLSSNSLYDFIALLVVNPKNQEAMRDSMKQRPTNL